MNDAGRPNLFPTLDSIEAVLWPALAIFVFVVTAVLVDLMIVLAARWRLVDLPNRRSAHALPTARGGGVAIVATATLASLAVVFRWPPATAEVLLGVLLPSLVIAGFGILDDMRPIRPLARLAVQVGVGAAMTAVLGPLESLALPGLPPLALGPLGWPLTVLWIVGMTNAFNFMDGSDGMAALGAVIGGGVLALVGWAAGAHLPLLLAAFAAAAAGGFLVFNWQPARVFMGDVGSAFLGTLLAAVPLLFPEEDRPIAIVAAALALWPYIFDPLVSVLRRLWHGRNPLLPHREFFFHRLIRSGRSHAFAAALYAALAAAGGVAALCLFVEGVPEPVRVFAVCIVVALAAWLPWVVERRCARVNLAGADSPEGSGGGEGA